MTLAKARLLPGWSESEQRALAEGTRRQLAKAVEWEARSALADPARDPRKELLLLCRTSGVRPGLRMRALLAAAVPGLARRRFQATSPAWTGAGGVAGD